MADQMRFQRLGGYFQLSLETEKDLKNILNLDEAHWAMTSADISAFVADKNFLLFLNHDNNSRIRVDDVKAALKWMFAVLRNLDGVVKGSDTLLLDSINTDHPDGAEILRTAEVALANLGAADRKSITLAQICDQKNIVAEALQNGDGIIPPDSLVNRHAADCIRGIMAAIGSRKDISGLDGIGTEELTAFKTQAAARLAWLNNRDANYDTIFPYGDKTAAAAGSLKGLKEVIDSFFKSCQALDLSAAAGENRCAVQNTLDPMNAESVDSFLAKSPVAPVNTACELKLSSVRHPVWHKKILSFFQSLPDTEGDIVSFARWEEIKAKLAPYETWISQKPETKIEAWDPADLRAVSEDGTITFIEDLIRKDLEVKRNLDNCCHVRKLILFQKNMLEFLNNFVSLDRLFDRTRPSMIQMGRLIMDGRCFTLCTTVNNPAEHKKIAQESNICVMYLDAVSGEGTAQKQMKLAVAVTSGTMRHLFVGKNGIFYTNDGVLWDAKVFDFIQQPVSISEAIKMPFFRFGEFLQKQADRFFSTRSKQYEDTLAKEIQAKSTLPAKSTPPPAPAPAAAVPPQQQTPALSGSMVLMGGGVGIAAIGSAFAFIAKSIQGISVSSILAIFGGILLVFGGPIIAISLNKLFRRNLSVFLEANGFALNGQMRLSLQMGRFFTYTPSLPGKIRIFTKKLLNIPNTLESFHAHRRVKILLVLLFVIVLAECLLLLWIRFGNCATPLH